MAGRGLFRHPVYPTRFKKQLPLSAPVTASASFSLEAVLLVPRSGTVRQYVFQDEFNTVTNTRLSSHTPDLGNMWTDVNDNYPTVYPAGHLDHSLLPSFTYHAWVDVGVSNGTFEFDALFSGADDIQLFRFAIRRASGQNPATWIGVESTGGTTQMVFSGTWSFNVPYNTTTNFKFVASGNSVDLLIDGVSQGAVSNSLTDTFIGVDAQGSSVDQWDAVLEFVRVYTETLLSFTLDAVLESSGSTFNGSFTLDAVILKTQSASFTLDAVVFKTIDASFALDAVIKREQSATFTLDSVFLKTIEASFTLNAIALRTASASFALDAAVAHEIWNDNFSRTDGPVTPKGFLSGPNGSRYFLHDTTSAVPLSIDGSKLISNPTGVATSQRESAYIGFPVLLEGGEIQFDFLTPSTVTDPSVNGELITFVGAIRRASDQNQQDTLTLISWDDAPTLQWAVDFFESPDLNPLSAAVFTPEPNTWYTAKAHFSSVSGTPIYTKVWKVGDPEPGWMGESTQSFANLSSFVRLHGYRRFNGVSNEVLPVYFDNHIIRTSGSFRIENGFLADAILLKTQSVSFALDAIIQRTQSASFALDAAIATLWFEDTFTRTTASPNVGNGWVALLDEGDTGSVRSNGSALELTGSAFSRLYQPVAQPLAGVFYIEFKTPTTDVLDDFWETDFNLFGYPDGDGVRPVLNVTVGNNGTGDGLHYVKLGSFQQNDVPLEASTWYALKVDYNLKADPPRYLKWWKVGDPEPGWLLASPEGQSLPGQSAYGHAPYVDATMALQFDNFRFYASDSEALFESAFFLNSIKLRTASASFTLDAVVMPSFTLDAVLASGTSTVEASFTLNAITLRTETASFTLDAVIQREQLASFVFDAIIFREQTATFALDAVIFRTQEATATLDAILFTTQTASFALDAVIVVTVTASFTFDAVVLREQTATFALDAVVFRTQEATVALDAIVFRTQEATFALDAIILQTQTASFTLDAVVFQTQSATFALDAVVFQTQTATFALDAVIMPTFTLDAVLMPTFTLDAFIFSLGQNIFTLDAVLLQTTEATFALDATIDWVGSPFWTTPANGVAIPPDAVLTFRIPASVGPMHFELQLDMVDTFDSGDLRIHKSRVDQTGWEYWNGSSWVPFTQAGVDPSFAGNEARFTISPALPPVTFWYRRARAEVI